MNNKVSLIDIILFRLYYISMVVEDSTRVKDYLTKTKLETLDYVINPYVGCPNKCLYCYAAYMSSFSKHAEEWGEFIDVKRTSKKINLYKIKNKKVMISTVTDPYNSYEEKYGVTRMLLEQLVNSEANINIVTKSKLITRDIDLFKQMKSVEVVLSICLTDEDLKSKLEPCSSSIAERIETLKMLKANGIKTVVFISPIIPMFTDYRQIIEMTKEYTDEYWFDRLNLRSSFKTKMFNFIKQEYPLLKNLYSDIYEKKNLNFFDIIFKKIHTYCEKNQIVYKSFYAGT